MIKGIEDVLFELFFGTSVVVLLEHGVVNFLHELCKGLVVVVFGVCEAHFFHVYGRRRGVGVVFVYMFVTIT